MLGHANSLLQVICCPRETVGSLKYRVLDNDLGYNLIFNNQVLEDDSKMLTDYGIKDGSTVRLAYFNNMGFYRDLKTFRLNNHS